MLCPICYNDTRSGRCPHDLSSRVVAANQTGRIDEDHRKGRIDVGTAIQQKRPIYQGGGR